MNLFAAPMAWDRLRWHPLPTRYIFGKTQRGTERIRMHTLLNDEPSNESDGENIQHFPSLVARQILDPPTTPANFK
jgi:hypothetical protein